MMSGFKFSNIAGCGTIGDNKQTNKSILSGLEVGKKRRKVEQKFELNTSLIGASPVNMCLNNALCNKSECKCSFENKSEKSLMEIDLRSKSALDNLYLSSLQNLKLISSYQLNQNTEAICSLMTESSLINNMLGISNGGGRGSGSNWPCNFSEDTLTGGSQLLHKARPVCNIIQQTKHCQDFRRIQTGNAMSLFNDVKSLASSSNNRGETISNYFKIDSVCATSNVGDDESVCSLKSKNLINSIRKEAFNAKIFKQEIRSETTLLKNSFTNRSMENIEKSRLAQTKEDEKNLKNIEALLEQSRQEFGQNIGNIISGINLQFQMNPIQEVNLRLLVLTIQWIKNMPLFVKLIPCDQKKLFEKSWKDLYVINLAHWTITMNTVSSIDHVAQSLQLYLDSAQCESNSLHKPVNTKESTKVSNESKVRSEEDSIDSEEGEEVIVVEDVANSDCDHENYVLQKEYKKIRKQANNEKSVMFFDIQNIQNIIERFREISPDGTECGCLKAIALLKPETSELIDRYTVEQLQVQAQCILIDYSKRRSIENDDCLTLDNNRFGKLLMMLPELRQIQTGTIEKVFFHDIVHQQSIKDIIEKIYNQ